MALEGLKCFLHIRPVDDEDNTKSEVKRAIRKLGVSLTLSLNDADIVIFHNGSEALLQNATALGKEVLTPLWLKACKTQNARVPSEPYRLMSSHVNPMSALQPADSNVPVAVKPNPKKKNPGAVKASSQEVTPAVPVPHAAPVVAVPDAKTPNRGSAGLAASVKAAGSSASSSSKKKGAKSKDESADSAEKKKPTKKETKAAAAEADAAAGGLNTLQRPYLLDDEDGVETPLFGAAKTGGSKSKSSPASGKKVQFSQASNSDASEAMAEEQPKKKRGRPPKNASASPKSEKAASTSSKKASPLAAVTSATEPLSTQGLADQIDGLLQDHKPQAAAVPSSQPPRALPRMSFGKFKAPRSAETGSSEDLPAPVLETAAPAKQAASPAPKPSRRTTTMALFDDEDESDSENKPLTELPKRSQSQEASEEDESASSGSSSSAGSSDASESSESASSGSEGESQSESQSSVDESETESEASSMDAKVAKKPAPKKTAKPAPKAKKSPVAAAVSKKPAVGAKRSRKAAESSSEDDDESEGSSASEASDSEVSSASPSAERDASEELPEKMARRSSGSEAGSDKKAAKAITRKKPTPKAQSTVSPLVQEAVAAAAAKRRQGDLLDERMAEPEHIDQPEDAKLTFCNPQPLRIVLTGSDSDAKELLVDVIESGFGRTKVVSEVFGRVAKPTHLVVADRQQEESRITPKILYALGAGIPIVTADWVWKSLDASVGQKRNLFLSPEAFYHPNFRAHVETLDEKRSKVEVRTQQFMLSNADDAKASEAEASREVRELKEATDLRSRLNFPFKSVLSNIRVFFDGVSGAPSNAECHELLSMLGADVVRTRDADGIDAVIRMGGGSKAGKQRSLEALGSAPIIQQQWITDCVTHLECLPFADYIIAERAASGEPKKRARTSGAANERLSERVASGISIGAAGEDATSPEGRLSRFSKTSTGPPSAVKHGVNQWTTQQLCDSPEGLASQRRRTESARLFSQ